MQLNPICPQQSTVPDSLALLLLTGSIISEPLKIRILY